MTVELVFTGIAELFTGDEPLVLNDAAVGFHQGRVVFVGPSSQAPNAHSTVKCGGLLGLPGLVDCHTHSCFAGSRAAEFQERLAGTSYTEILQRGGGILSTVQATRAASEAMLSETLTERLDLGLSRGITTVEVKSGYGLELGAELKMLRAITSANTVVRVLPTFLGAHAIPAEYRQDRAAYVDLLIREQIPAAASLARYADVYCDKGAFSLSEAEAVLRAAISHGLKPRIHAEQVVHTGAAAMAAELGALSADHLEHIQQDGIDSMARAGTVAVLLPGAMLYLGDDPPPVASFRAAGVPMAIATDFNPGSSPVADLWTCATLACLKMGLRVPEALLGVTRNAGLALGRPDLGRLASDSAADMVLVEPPPGEPASLSVLVQYLGGPRVCHLVKDGKLLFSAGRGSGPNTAFNREKA